MSLNPEDTKELLDEMVKTVEKVILPQYISNTWIKEIHTLKEYIRDLIEKQFVDLAPNFTINYCPHCGFQFRGNNDIPKA